MAAFEASIERLLKCSCPSLLKSFDTAPPELYAKAEAIG
jgi:hypothetical protein